jgi:hypothetical protein
MSLGPKPREKTRTRIFRSLAMAKWPNSCTVIVMPSTTIKARSVINNAIFLLRPPYDALKKEPAQHSGALWDVLRLCSGYRI